MPRTQRVASRYRTILPSPRHESGRRLGPAEDDATVRVALVLPTWDGYLSIALDEVIALPAPSPNVTRRVLRLLDDLAAIASLGKRSSLQARRRQVAN